MAGSGPLEPVPVFFRAAGGLGLLLLVIVILAAGSWMKRKVPGRMQKYTRVSRVYRRTL